MPQVYVPRYIGDIAKAVRAMHPEAAEDAEMLEEEKDQLLHEVKQMARYAHCLPWNVTINAQMAGKITRVASLNHVVDVHQEGNQASIALAEAERNTLGKDFVLYIRDENVNKPVVVSAINEHDEQAVLINIIPDLRPPLIRNRQLSDKACAFSLEFREEAKGVEP